MVGCRRRRLLPAARRPVGLAEPPVVAAAATAPGPEAASAGGAGVLRDLRLRLRLRFGLCRRRQRAWPRPRRRRRLLGRRLVAFHQIRRHARFGARHAVSETAARGRPAVFFLVLKTSDGQHFGRIELTARRASRRAASTDRKRSTATDELRGKRVAPASAQPLPLAAISSLRTSARLRVPGGVCGSVDDHVGPLPRRGHVARLPGRKRQQLARAVAERPVRRGQRLEPGAQSSVRTTCRPGEIRRAASARSRMHLAGASVGGDLVIGRDRGLADRSAPSSAASRKRASTRYPPVPSAASLANAASASCVLAGLRERHRLLEGGAGFSRLLGLPPLVAAPARRPPTTTRTQRGDDVIAVTLPQLLELLATDFLVDFMENIGHGACPSTTPKFGEPPPAFLPACASVRTEDRQNQGIPGG